MLAQLLYNPLGKRVNPETSEVAEAAAIAAGGAGLDV